MIKVFIICSGLGHIKRGIESFTQEAFKALSPVESLDITLFKGGGKPDQKEIVLWNLPRQNPMTIKLSKIFKKDERRDPYFLEQFSFFLSLIPHLYIQKPDLIYFLDVNLGTLLWQWRRITKQNYKLLFCNGGPCLPTYFYRWDHVQQVVPMNLKTALDVGVIAEKQSLVPHGIHIPSEPPTLAPSEREALRRRLGLPENRPLILSVAAINKSHKRMDYVVSEIASLPEPRPYVLLLGQQDEESSEILELGNRLLGAENFQIRTVDRNEVSDYYMVADAFVLASLREGFGLVFLEAMSYGLPCLAHDYEITRFVLANQGYLANFEIPGSLAGLVSKALAETKDVSKRYLRHRTVYERFSWDKICPDYVDLILKVSSL
jgi:glycosyltransferase involved in cell wall biosynthesis